ncbi:MAG: IS30 family transposase [Arcticibacterium sp.]|jgi:IS30 family transposase
MGCMRQIIRILDNDLRISTNERKERIEDLEIDLVIGKNHQEALLTINDRVTSVLKMTKVTSKRLK